MFTLIHKALTIPSVFALQQKICNNYKTTRNHFSAYLTPGSKILDMGCSTGDCANALFDFNQVDYHGIDTEQGYIDHAQKKYPQGNFHCMDVRHMDFKENSFDIALFIGILHHLPDDLIIASCKPILKLLKPHGKLLIAEPTFTKGKPLSTLLLKHDRGNYIRNCQEYKSLFLDHFNLIEEDYYRFSVHRFCSLVLGVPQTG